VWAGAGSGCSRSIAKPAHQRDSGCSKRMVADVAAVAGEQWALGRSGGGAVGVPALPVVPQPHTRFMAAGSTSTLGRSENARLAPNHHHIACQQALPHSPLTRLLPPSTPPPAQTPTPAWPSSSPSPTATLAGPCLGAPARRRPSSEVSLRPSTAGLRLGWAEGWAEGCTGGSV
jgi:hypothetical protein